MALEHTLELHILVITILSCYNITIVSEYFLFEEQQRMSEQRVLFDAELIREGATINSLGCLGITEAQYWRLKSLENEIPCLETWLTSDISDVYLDSGLAELMGNRPLKILLRNKIQKVQHILALGRNGMPQGIGDKSYHAIELMLSNNFGIDWKNSPTVEDIAGYCNSLDEVPGQVVHRRVKNELSVSEVLQIAETNDDLSSALFFYINGGRKELDEKSKLSVMNSVKSQTIAFADNFTNYKADIISTT